MKQFSFIFTWLTVALLFSYCQPKSNANQASTEAQETTLPDMHNAYNALDWQGTYKGTLPCADCAGIETRITINNDLTYHISRKYLEENDATFEENGTFSWNEEGNTIKLSEGGQYFVGENTLFHLDQEGNRVTGELANYYRLEKVSTDNILSPTITQTYWKLIELEGQPVQATAGNRESHIRLNSDENRVSGFAGCNGFGGSYKIEADQITFSQLFSTKMACPDLDTENKFMKVMEATRSFKIEKNLLLLFGSDKTPLAKFESTNN